MSEESGLYSQGFYEGQKEGSVASAEIVVPIILSLFPCKSVVDVGCGVGGWLKAFEQHGVEEYLGVDGDYVPRELLKIPQERFLPADLRNFPDIECFDIACSFEVAEHLPEDSADAFVAALVKAAPVIVFSAAIPHQGGTDHINEQWQSYWCEKFERNGYVAVDCIRPRIYRDERVEWWYRQNTVVYCKPHRCPPDYAPVQAAYDLNRVDPAMLANLASRRYLPWSGGEAEKMIRHCLRVLLRATWRKMLGIVGI